MKAFCSIFLLLCIPCFSLKAQYFYNDIYRTEQTNLQHQQYQKARVQHIQIKSFDANNALNKGFHCEKKLSGDYKSSVMRSNSASTGSSVLISYFDDSGRIIRSIDSTAMSVNKTWFYYHKTGQIDSLVFFSYSNETTDSFLYQKTTFSYREKHIYHYDQNGRYVKMERIKNGKPNAIVEFRTDSLGRITKETVKNKQEDVPAFYYKYDSHGRLTDIFHFNSTRQKMAPDYLFDYDEKGRLTSKTTVMMNTSDYLVWKYTYTAEGLISKEECYGKDQALQGLLKFDYSL